GVQRVRHHVSIFLGSYRMPFTHRYFAIVAAAGNARRTAFLLAAAEPVRKSVISIHVIHLRGRLVVPGTPAFAAIYRHDGALVTHDDEGLRIVGVDPQILVVITARCAAEARPCLAAIGRLPRHRAGYNHGV